MNLETLVAGLVTPRQVPVHIQPDYATVYGWVVDGELVRAAHRLYQVLRDARSGTRPPGADFYASAGLIFAWASAASSDWRENQELGHFAIVCWSEAAQMGFPRAAVERLAPSAWAEHLDAAWADAP